MRLTELGVSINAKGAKAGAAETKAALNDIAASATTTTAALTATSTAATGAIGKQAAATREWGYATRLTSVDLAISTKRYADEVAALSGTTVATEQLTDSTRAHTLTQMRAIELDKARTAAQGGLIGALTGGGVQLGLIRRELGTLVGRITGTNAAVDRLAASFGSLAAGSGPVIGVLIGIAAIGFVYEKLTEKSAALEAKTQDALKALKDLADQQRLGVGGKLAEDLKLGTEELGKQILKLRELKALSAQESPDSKRLFSLAEQSKDTKKLIDTDLANTLAGRLALRKIIDDANKAESSAESGRLAQLVTANAATAAETRSAGERLKNLRAAITTSVASNGDATERVRLIADADALSKALNPVVKVSKEAKAELKAAADEATQFYVAMMKGAQALADANAAQETEYADAQKTVAQTLADLQKENDLRTAQVVALGVSQAAYEKVVAAQQDQVIVQGVIDDARKKGLEINGDVLDQLRQELTLRRALTGDIKAGSDGGRSDTKKRDAVAIREIGAAASDIARAAQSAEGLASAFGNVGRNVASTIGSVGQLANAISQVQRAGITTDALGKKTDVGFTGALSGAAGLAGMATGVGALIAITTATIAFAKSLDLTNEKEKAIVKTIEERIRADLALQASLNAVRASLSGDTMGVALAGVKAQFDALRASAEQVYAGKTNEAVRARTLTDIATLETQRLTQLRDEAIATSKASIADAQRIDGINAATAAEAAFQKARAQTNFVGGVTQRQQALAGDTRGAFVTGQSNTAASATDAAYDLLKAGTITIGMFEAMATVIRGELSKSIAEFDAQAAAAATALEKATALQLADVDVRVLVAQGRTVEATQARQAVANARELDGVTNAAIRSQIEYAQALEEVGRQNQILSDQAKKTADIVASISDRALTAIRRISPELAKQIDDDNKKAAREAELAAASSEGVRAALRYLYALQDTADAMNEAATATQRAADAAKALASFTGSVEDAYLRSAGKSFDADIKQLQKKRDDQLEIAHSTKASQDTIDQIKATYENNYNALVKAQLTQSTVSNANTALAGLALGTRASSVVANTQSAFDPTRDVVTRVAGGLTEITAVSWLDLGHAQLAVLLRIEQKIGQPDTVTVSVSNTNGGSVTPSAISRATIDQINRVLGYDLSLDAQRVGG